MLAVALSSCTGFALQRSVPLPHTVQSRASTVVCDEDRCYYGYVDADGSTSKADPSKKRTGPVPTPDPSLSPADMVNAQFQMLSESAVEDAYAFLDPGIIEKYSMDVKKFRSILKGPSFDGLIGCAEWTITSESAPDENVAVIKLRVLPKPIPGCVRTSGMADQGGITWPTNYKWQLRKQPATAEVSPGCWMLEQMFPDAPPIDVEGQDGTPLIDLAKSM